MECGPGWRRGCQVRWAATRWHDPGQQIMVSSMRGTQKHEPGHPLNARISEKAALPGQPGRLVSSTYVYP